MNNEESVQEMMMPNYPGVADRVKAIVVDSIMIIVFIITITYFFTLFNNPPDEAKIIAFIFIFVLYDPLFTSIFGGTLGHMAFNLRVRREKDETKKILFPIAIIRFIVKIALGWISFLTVSGTEKRRAIHDYLAGSVVVYHESSKN